MVPDGQCTRDFEPVHGFAVLGTKLVCGFITFDTQGVKQTANVLIQLDIAAQFVKEVGLRGCGIELDTGAAGQVLSQSLAQLSQLDKCGVGITGKDLFGRARKL
ncbi:hypothetical protein D3C86_1193070 [compost metagenome]